MQAGENKKDWFRAVNPKSKIPTLTLDDGRVLTERPAVRRVMTVWGEA